MIPLHVHGRLDTRIPQAILGRITRTSWPRDERARLIRCLEPGLEDPDLEGYAAVLSTTQEGPAAPRLVRVPSLGHLEEGDIVALQPSGFVRTLFRVSSPHNALFATDRCNSLCVMCSQPPRPTDDTGRVDELLSLLDLIPPETKELGVTGGEPTLLEDGLLRVLERAKERLPTTAIHLLTNGRAFANAAFSSRLAGIGHTDLVLGIPLYSALASEHDYIVQARGAFDETVRGLLQLARQGVRVEIRVVLHRLTIPHLVELVEFLYRNLTFAEHVALMGLEPMGFGAAHFEWLYQNPLDYADELRRATRFLAERGMAVSLYNLPLCLLPRDLWPFAVASISDWKRDYPAVCAGCEVRDRCGGVFSSALAYRLGASLFPISLGDPDDRPSMY